MMNKQQLEKYITHPENLSLSTIPDMEKLVEAFPYFQTAHLLYVKNLGKEHNIHFNQQLRLAAAYAGDRAILKKLLEQASPGTSTENINGFATARPSEPLEYHENGEEKINPDSHPVKNAYDKSGKTSLEEEQKEQNIHISTETDHSTVTTESAGPANIVKNKSEESETGTASISETPAARRKRELEQLKREMDELKKERQTIEKVIREEEQRKMQQKERSSAKTTAKSTDWESRKTGATEVASETKNTNIPSSAVETPEPNKGRNTKGSQKKSKQEIIDRFIREEPSIRRTNSVFYDPTEAARRSILQSDDLATETLARIYRKQGKVLQAIKIYEKLSLKFPQKSDYFANQIQEIKKTNK